MMHILPLHIKELTRYIPQNYQRPITFHFPDIHSFYCFNELEWDLFNQLIQHANELVDAFLHKMAFYHTNSPMKTSLLTQFTLFDIQQNIKTSTSFLDRFEGSNNNLMYTIDELGILNNINPNLLIAILLKFEKESINESDFDTRYFEKYALINFLKYVEITH